MTPRRTHRLLALALPLLGGCSGWFFSGVPYPDRTRPVVRIETRGGVEYGAATAVGVLFLGRTAASGPCRVRFFLGEQPLVCDVYFANLSKWWKMREHLRARHPGFCDAMERVDALPEVAPVWRRHWS